MKRIVLAVGLALALLPLCAWAGSPTDAKAATEPVVLQLEAFRRDDYDTAFGFASAEIQAQFDRQSFEVMVRRGYPEIARSSFATFVKAELAPHGAAYVTVRIRGANGQSIDALYELVWQDGWKINGVVTRPVGVI